MKVDENVMVAKLGDLGSLVELEAIESLFACDLPLLSC